MIIKKNIEYKTTNFLGKELPTRIILGLKVLKESSNYLVFKGLRHYYNLYYGKISSTKTRGNVSGSGKKPWRQKSTGRARAGSTRSPLWRGGGITFGPQPILRYTKINKKEQNLILQILLYNKKDSIIIINNLENNYTFLKTKNFLRILSNLNIKLDKKILLVVSKKTIFLERTTKNIKNIKIILDSELDCFNLLTKEQFLITSTALSNIKKKLL
uniref:Large ribosomal subunit protein uL4c n=1 Tax=Nitzschia sp. PL1-4 TaxID=2083272 RepID=A0A2Z5ZAJ5_9STRA|nr:ribosomal protein L4 [Nitzschia sp. PL1-4]